MGLIKPQLGNRSLLCLIESDASVIKGKGGVFVQSVLDLVKNDEAFRKALSEYLEKLDNEEASHALVTLPNLATQPFSYGEFFVEVSNSRNGCYEFWLSHKDYGVKKLMFGIPANDISTIDDMSLLILNTIENYIDAYTEEFMDE